MVKKLPFIENLNLNLKMLNQSRLNLNEYGTRRLVNNVYYVILLNDGTQFA